MVPGTAGAGLPDPAPGLPDPEPLPASEPPLELVAEPDELAPAPVPAAPDDPEAAPEPEPGTEDVPGVGFPLLLGTVAAPEDPVAVIVPPPPELEPPVSPAGEVPPAGPELAGEGLPPPEQAIGPRSTSTGRNERRCRLVVMVRPRLSNLATWPLLHCVCAPAVLSSSHSLKRRAQGSCPDSCVLLAGCSSTSTLQFGCLDQPSNALLKLRRVVEANAGLHGLGD
jgi:hypothetical protein